MRVVKSTYIEKTYCPVNTSDDVIKIEKVLERDPLEVLYETNLVGFRFFDVLQTMVGCKVVSSDSPINYSPMYYFGDRLSYQDLLMLGDDDFIRNLQLQYLDRKELEEAIFCKCGVIIDSCCSEDMTIDEAKLSELEKRKRQIMINQSEFFNGLGELLDSNTRSDVTLTVSEVMEPVVLDEELCDEEAIVREYSLYADKYLLTSSLGIVQAKRLGNMSQDTYFSLENAAKAIEPLYQEYPYLRKIMKDYKLAISNNGFEALDIPFGKQENKEKVKR